jgi:hypothetical protein
MAGAEGEEAAAAEEVSPRDFAGRAGGGGGFAVEKRRPMLLPSLVAWVALPRRSPLDTLPPRLRALIGTDECAASFPNPANLRLLRLIDDARCSLSFDLELGYTLNTPRNDGGRGRYVTGWKVKEDPGAAPDCGTPPTVFPALPPVLAADVGAWSWAELVAALGVDVARATTFFAVPCSNPP